MASTQDAVAGALGEIKDPRTIPPLIASLKDSSYEVQQGARLTLGKMGGPPWNRFWLC